MNKLILKIENIPSNYIGIQNSILPISNIQIDYDELRYKKNYKEIFQNNRCVVLYLPNKSKSIGHWVLMINQGDYIEFFDPYGLHITQLRYILGLENYLERIIHQDRKKIIFNNVRYQKFREHINTCARHCAVRGRLSDLSLKEYHNLIFDTKNNPDELVSILTLLTIPNNENIVKLIRKHI